MQRDSIDFGTMKVSRLFRKIFIPTLLGMVLSSTMNIADGIFVGQGAGSAALAAVNIVVPLYMVAIGVGLMFGSGVSIVASIHLARGEAKAARINVTQAYTVATLAMVVLAVIVLAAPTATARMLGSSDELLPLVREYMCIVMAALPFSMWMNIGLFVLRLDGSPRWSMWANAVPALFNIVGDYVLVFPCGMGLAGAAWATAAAQVLGGVLVLIYMTRRAQTLTLYRPKFSPTALRLTCRNVGYVARMGVSAMVGGTASAVMMWAGNTMFIAMLGEEGVAAFSVACYCFPIPFMISNAIAQSVQPIISFNYGCGHAERVRAATRLSLWYAVGCGAALTLLSVLLCRGLVSLFIAGGLAHDLATAGLPLFASGFLLFTINVVCIGYYQSVERFRPASVFMLLRGVVLVVPAFMLLPRLWGVAGLWLAVPVAEAVTLLLIIIYYMVGRRMNTSSDVARHVPT